MHNTGYDEIIKIVPFKQLIGAMMNFIHGKCIGLPKMLTKYRMVVSKTGGTIGSYG